MNNKDRKSPRLGNWDYGRNAAYFITICTKDREHYFGEIQNNKLNVSPAGAIAYVLWHEIKNHVKNIELGEFVVMPNHVHGILILNGNNIHADDAVSGRVVDDSKGNFRCRDVDNSEGRHDAVSGRDLEDIDGNFRRDVEDSDGRDDAVSGRDVDDSEGNFHFRRDVACNVPTEMEMEMEMKTKTGMEPVNPFKNEQMAAISPKKNTISSIIRSYKSAVTKYCNRLELPMTWQPRYHDHIIRNDQSFRRISEYIINNPLNWSDDQFYI
jgi:putative transposase